MERNNSREDCDQFSPGSNESFNEFKSEVATDNTKYDKIWRKVRIKLRSKYFLSNVSNKTFPIPDRYLSDNETLQFLPRFILHPHSKAKIFWNLLVAFTLIYTSFISSFTMAFIETPQFSIWEIIDLLLDFIYFLDFLVNLNSAYFDSSGELISSRRKIMFTYLKSWMIVDILSFIPFSLITLQTDVNTKNTNKFVRFIKLPRLYKLFKMTRLLKLLNSKKTQEVFIRMQDFLSIKHSATRFFISIMSILIAVHISSCIWYFTAKIDDFSPDTWVVRYDYQDADIFTLYITCLYWSFTTLTTVGYGDISAETSLEKIFCIIWMIICLYFLGFTIGSLSAFMANNQTKEKNLTNKLALIDEFIADSHLNKNMAKKLRHALKYSTEISGFSWGHKQTIFNELPKGLKFEVARAMFKGAVRNISFFVDKDPAIVSTIVPFLTPSYFGYGETVYKEDDFADEIYFIVKGAVNYVFEEDFVISSINKSDYFGDIEVVFQVPRSFSAVSTRCLDLLAMNRKILNKMKTEYSRVWDEIKSVAMERDRKNKIMKAKLIRRSKKLIRRTMKGEIGAIKPTNPCLEDISDQLRFLFEFAESLNKKFKKIKHMVINSQNQHSPKTENLKI